MQCRDAPQDWDSELPSFAADGKGMATRDASGKVLNVLTEKMPWLLGGAADLAPSTKTHLSFEFAEDFQSPDNYCGRSFHHDVREHAMCTISNSNGLNLSKLRALATRFLVLKHMDGLPPSVQQTWQQVRNWPA